jgi:hypothetical protein
MIGMRPKFIPIHMIAEAEFTELINQMLNILPLADRSPLRYPLPLPQPPTKLLHPSIVLFDTSSKLLIRQKREK